MKHYLYLVCLLFVFLPALGPCWVPEAYARDHLSGLCAPQFQIAGSAPRLVPEPLEDSSASQQPKSVVKVKGLNSPARDNNPIISADGNLIFFNSTRYDNRPWARWDSVEKRFDEDIYFATRQSDKRDDETWSVPINLGPDINTGQDDGVVAISPDGQTIYFNSMKPGWDLDGGPFYTAKLHGVIWTDIQGMGGWLNTFLASAAKGRQFRLYGAAISSDGRSFYFATTAFSEKNQHELWVSHIGPDGQWGWPENLGPDVNSGNGNYAPFLAADNKTLFFASKHRDGYGGDDIWMTTLTDDQWSVPHNIGWPINSFADESFMSVTASGERLYLCSNRDGNDEIYTVPLPSALSPINVALLSGCITDAKTGAPLEASIIVEDMRTGSRMLNVGSNSASGEYLVVLQPGRDYSITVSAPGYVYLNEHYRLPVGMKYREHTIDYALRKLSYGGSFTANNIFFEYNLATIAPESKPELDEWIGLLNDYPNLLVEISGHTDSIGTPAYNRALSLRRAKAVRDYLVVYGGISPGRLNVKGYGADKPVAANDTEEGRRKNRRTQFTVKTEQNDTIRNLQQIQQSPGRHAH